MPDDVSLFDKILFAYIVIGCLGAFFYFMIYVVILVIQIVFPAVDEPCEKFLQKIKTVLDPINKSFFPIFFLLVAIRLIAGFLGWLPPFFE